VNVNEGRGFLLVNVVRAPRRRRQSSSSGWGARKGTTQLKTTVNKKRKTKKKYIYYGAALRSREIEEFREKPWNVYYEEEDCLLYLLDIEYSAL